MAKKTAVRDGYDRLAAVYAAQRSATGPATRRARAFAERFAADERVLDAGCGCGKPVLSLLADRTTAVGLDISKEQLALAQSNVPASQLSRGDLTRLPYDDDVFAGVVCYWTLIHVPLAEHRTVISEFARVLRPGGRVLLIEGADEWIGENDDWLEADVRMEWEMAGAEATSNQLEATGFEITDRVAVPDSLDDDAEGRPWTVFEARLTD